MSGGIDARPCTAADLPQLHSTWPSSAEVHDRHYAGQLNETQTLVVAWERGVALGSAVVRWDSQGFAEALSAYPGVVEVAHLQVRFDARRRGVGTGLVEAAERLARLRRERWLGLGVGVDNPEARALYERLGYEHTGIVERSEYCFMDESGTEHQAVEWNEYMIKDLGAAPTLGRSRSARDADE